MNRLPSQSGIEVPGAAERIVTNPVYRLLAAMIASLCMLVGTIGIAYVSLKVSSIESVLSAQDARNDHQDHEIQVLREWRIQQDARGSMQDWYREFLKNSKSQGDEFTALIRDIRDRLPDPRKRR